MAHTPHVSPLFDATSRYARRCVQGAQAEPDDEGGEDETQLILGKADGGGGGGGGSDRGAAHERGHQVQAQVSEPMMCPRARHYRDTHSLYSY